MEQNKIYSYNKNNERIKVIYRNELFQEKDNDFDLISLVDKINNINIKFFHSKKRLKIKSNSIKKILSLIDNENNLSDIYLDYIILNIKYHNKKNKNLENYDDNELDIKYYKILDKTKIFHINFEIIKKVKIEDINNKIQIHRKSLNKIFNYLGETIVSMSDYIILINILIKEEDEINNNNSNSYQQSTIFNEKQINLNGIKLFKNELKIPNKNKEQSIYKYDILFTNVLNCIDDYEKDSSFSDDMINIATPKKTIDVEILKNDLNLLEDEGIITDENIKTNNNNKISNNKNNEKDLYFSFTLDDKDNQCILAKKKQKNFTPAIKYIKFLNTESIILGTNHGQIILLDIINKKMDKIFFNDKETRVINSIDIILNKFILIGLSDGNIQIIEIENFKTNSETINLFHNIRITYISHKIIKENKEFFIIFSTALGHSKIYYFQNLDIIKFEDLIKKLKPIINNFLYLNTGIRFPIGISSFELIKLENINNSYMIFLGDYGGRIYYTQIKKITNQLYNYNDIKYKQIHNDDKITNIIFSYNQNILYTFSRDGRIKKFILTNVLKFNFSLKEIDSIYKNDISSYEIVLFNKINDFENDNFFIIGHHGRNLLIYNTNSKLIIHSNDVKGVNRPLDAIYSLKNLKIYYAVSQSNKVYIYEILNKNEDKNIINKGFICNYSNFIHGRVIHNLNFFCVDKLKNIFLITSCSEDTKVNFFLIENLNLVFEKNENLIFIGQFSMHECAVRKIKIIDFIYEDENKLKIKEVFFMSIGSKCECFIYKIVLNLEKKNCQIFLLKDLTKRKNKKEKNIVNFDFENTRNLDLTSVIIWENNVKKYNIYISNSCFLTNYYLIQIEENECLIIKNEEYKNVTSNFIPLSINHVVNNSNKIFLIFGLTNGNFNILNYEKKIDLYYKLHESGINDLKIINGIKTNIFNIISSGEDCSIGISELDLNDDNLKLSLIKKIRNLHFSAIKSISLEKIDENNYFIISGSYDQLLNV